MIRTAKLNFIQRILAKLFPLSRAQRGLTAKQICIVVNVWRAR